MVDPLTFARCKSLKKIEFLEGRETFRENEEDVKNWNQFFRETEVEEITLPSTLREISPAIFDGCDSLKTVWVAKGYKAKVKKFVGTNVEVRWK